MALSGKLVVNPTEVIGSAIQRSFDVLIVHSVLLKT